MTLAAIKKFIIYWLPPLLWMVFIFILSSRQRVNLTNKLVYNFLIFKTLHMIEYAILNFLLFRALYNISDKKLKLRKKLLYSVVLSVIYAVSDEIHQTFVPTREGKIRDLFIDTVGIFLMYIYIKNCLSFVKKFL